MLRWNGFTIMSTKLNFEQACKAIAPKLITCALPIPFIAPHMAIDTKVNAIVKINVSGNSPQKAIWALPQCYHFYRNSSLGLALTGTSLD